MNVSVDQICLSAPVYRLRCVNLTAHQFGVTPAALAASAVCGKLKNKLQFFAKCYII